MSREQLEAFVRQHNFTGEHYDGNSPRAVAARFLHWNGGSIDNAIGQVNGGSSEGWPYGGVNRSDVLQVLRDLRTPAQVS